jgi:hypothetical protein
LDIKANIGDNYSVYCANSSSCGLLWRFWSGKYAIFYFNIWSLVLNVGWFTDYQNDDSFSANVYMHIMINRKFTDPWMDITFDL